MRELEPAWPLHERRQNPGNGQVAVAFINPQSGGDAMDLYRKLWRRKGTILLVMVVAGVLGLIVAGLLTPRYSAQTDVMIGIETPNVSNITSVLKDIAANQETVQGEGYVIQSRSVAEQAVRRLALDQDPEFNPSLRPESRLQQLLAPVMGFVKQDIVQPLEALIGAKPEAAPAISDQQRAQHLQDSVTSNLMSHIDVTPLKRSHVLEITAQAGNPEIAARIANTMADLYIEQQLIRKTHAATKATGWLDQQIADLRQQVEKSERAVEEYRREHGLYETKSDMVTSQQVNELNTQLVLAESQKAEAAAKLAQAEKVLRDPSGVDALPAVVNSPLIQALRQKQIEMERSSAELSSTYGPQHPKIREINAQLHDIKAKINAEVGKVVSALRHEAQSTAARYQSLHDSLGQLQKEMGSEGEKSIRLRELQSQAEANQQLLRNFLDRSKETSVQQNLTEPDATVISKAVPPQQPSFPPTRMFALFGVLAGGLLGAVLAILLENLDRSLRTRKQVEELTRLPTLAMIPAARPGRGLIRDSAESPDTPFSEAVRNLHTRLLMSAPEQPPRIIMFTSAAPNEGKSRIAVAMGRSAAYSGRRVIILDCDWRRPALHRFFGRPVGPGLADLLAGGATPDEAVYQDRNSGAHAIFAGNAGRMESDPQRIERLGQLLQTLAKHYDLVVVDSPPVITGSEALPLARMADRVAFVVKWGTTPRELVQEGLRQLMQAHSKIAGIVLSQVDPKRYRRYGLDDIVYPYRRADVVWGAD